MNAPSVIKPVFTRTFFALLALLIFQFSCAGNVIKQEALTIETKNNGPVTFHIELADKREKQELGLMNRPSLPEDAGMLFIFPEVGQHAFWMKNTLIPLDMIFISEDGTIHHIHHMARPLDLTKATSERPSKAVLEINGGLSDILGIEPGDKVVHPVFHNQLTD